MTITQAIDKADMLRPNAIPYAIKAGWVLDLDGQFEEMMGIEGEERDKEQLLIGAPHENAYVLHVCAMIDLAQEETDLYQDDFMQANQALSEARAWYRRHNCPERGVYYRRVWH